MVLVTLRASAKLAQHRGSGHPGLSVPFRGPETGGPQHCPRMADGWGLTRHGVWSLISAGDCCDSSTPLPGGARYRHPRWLCPGIGPITIIVRILLLR